MFKRFVGGKTRRLHLHKWVSYQIGLLFVLFHHLKMLCGPPLCFCAAGTKQAENEWRCYHRYLLQKSLSSTFYVRPHHWKVIWQLIRGAEDRMDERRVSLGHCLCFKAVWETARGEEFISSSEQSRAKTIADLWEEFKGIISKELEDDSHRWDSASQITRRYWGELISQESREPLQLRRQHQVQG